MARLAKCKGENCNIELPLDNRYRHSNKWYCKECYEKIITSRLPKCNGENCNKLLQPDERYKYSGKWYCKECYEKEINKPNPYKDLISYICTEFNIEAPKSIILSQIKNLKNKNNYTYGGIQYTIWYFKYILNKQPEEKYGLAFVKYYYNDAKKYFDEQMAIENKITEMKSKSVSKKKKVIKYKSNANNGSSFLKNIQ